MGLFGQKVTSSAFSAVVRTGRRCLSWIPVIVGMLHPEWHLFHPCGFLTEVAKSIMRESRANLEALWLLMNNAALPENNDKRNERNMAVLLTPVQTCFFNGKWKDNFHPCNVILGVFSPGFSLWTYVFSLLSLQVRTKQKFCDSRDEVYSCLLDPDLYISAWISSHFRLDLPPNLGHDHRRICRLWTASCGVESSRKPTTCHIWPQ